MREMCDMRVYGTDVTVPYMFAACFRFPNVSQETKKDCGEDWCNLRQLDVIGISTFPPQSSEHGAIEDGNEFNSGS